MLHQAETVPPVILASTSPYRRQILNDAGVTVRCVAPGVDESLETSTDPVSRACALALAKAIAVGESDSIVVGADQVAFDPRSKEVFGKPRDPDAHQRRLEGLRGRSHDLVTGFAVVHGSWQFVGHERSVVHMRSDVSEEEIAQYVAGGEGAGCAAGYAAEAHGGFLIEQIEGDWTNVIGLPIFRIMTVLRQRGWRYGHG